MLYLVRQQPRAKYRHAMMTSFVIVEATTGAAAIRRAREFHGEYISDVGRECLAPTAVPLVEGIRGYI